MKPSCLIIDDEPLARKGLIEDLATIGLVTVMGSAANADEAAAKLSLQPVDIILLDIEMPQISGLRLLENLAAKPLVILVTAYPQYALAGYDHGVIDYLVKPVSLQRLRLACEKTVEQHELRRSTAGPHLFLKVNGAHERVAIADILYIEAANNYVQVHTAHKKLLIYLSLKGIEEQLPAEAFIRVHKSFLVARRHIQRIDGNHIIVAAPLSPTTPSGMAAPSVAAATLPLSRRFKGAVLAQLPLTNKTRPLG